MARRGAPLSPIPSYVCTCKQKTAPPIILKFDSHTTMERHSFSIDR